MALSIIEALAKLDPRNDNHWTMEGQPRLDTVKFFAGVPNLMREDLDKVAVFTRQDALAGKVPVSVAAPAATAPTNEQPTAAPVPAAATNSAPTAPIPPVAPVAPAAVKPFDLEEAKQQLASLEKELAEVNQQLHQLKIKRDGINAKADPIRDQIAKNTPADTTSHAIQQYHDSQRQILADRALQIGRATSFQESTGVKLTDLIPKRAPIDNALARKNSRGTGRPR